MATGQELKNELDDIGALVRFTAVGLRDIDTKIVDGRKLHANRLDLRQVYTDAVHKLKSGAAFNSLSEAERHIVAKASQAGFAPPPVSYNDAGIPPPQPLIPIPEDMIPLAPAPGNKPIAPLAEQLEFEFVQSITESTVPEDIRRLDIIEKRLHTLIDQMKYAHRKIDKILQLLPQSDAQSDTQSDTQSDALICKSVKSPLKRIKEGDDKPT